MPLWAHIAIGLWIGGVAIAATYKLVDYLERRKSIREG